MDRPMRLPYRHQSGLVLGAFLAGAFLSAATTLALLSGEASPRPGTVSGETMTFERPGGRGEMEFPGVEAAPGLVPTTRTSYRYETRRGGLMELPGLEVAPALAPQGEARGGPQEFAATR